MCSNDSYTVIRPDNWETLELWPEEHSRIGFFRILRENDRADYAIVQMSHRNENEREIPQDDEAVEVIGDKKWAEIGYVLVKKQLSWGMNEAWEIIEGYGHRGSVPTNVALEGKKYIAAYEGFIRRDAENYNLGTNRKSVAKIIGVSEQTISNYWSEVREEAPTVE